MPSPADTPRYNSCVPNSLKRGDNSARSRMASNWQALKIDLGPIPELAQAVQSLADAINLALSIIKTATEIISALVIDTLNAEALLIRAALQAIEDILNQFIQGSAKLHLLVVPPRKALPYLDEKAPGWTVYDNPYTMISAPPYEDARDFYTKLDSVFNVLGGNPAYGRTVIESLADEADVNRPQYGDTDAYFAVAILAGHTSIIELLGYIMALMNVFKGAVKQPLAPTEIARPPQDLKVSTVAAPNSSRVAVRLTWKNAPTKQEIKGFSSPYSLYTRIDEIAIIRTTDPSLLTAKLWSDLFAGYQPTALSGTDQEQKNVKTIKTSKGTTTLVRVFKYDGVMDTFIDDDASLTKGVNFFYTLAYRYSLALPDADGKLTKQSYLAQNYAAISNVAKAVVDKDRYVTHRAGNFPDWDATPSALDLIPDLKFFLALIKNYVETMKSQVVGAQSALNSYVAFLKSEIDRYSAYAAAVSDRIRSLSEIMRLPQQGIYLTAMESASGGTPDFMNTIMTRLLDEQDPTAPPYFRHGVTAGLVIYAGAPNPAELASVKELLSLLLGLNTGHTALEQATASIDQVLTTLETPAAVVATPSQVTFDDAMGPVDAGDPAANVPFDP